MNELVRLDRLGIRNNGATLSMSLAAGQMLAITGRSGAGKSRFLRTACGSLAAVQGQVQVLEEVHLAAPLPRRMHLQTLCRESPKAAEVLVALGLWEQRQKTIAELSGSQASTASLAQALANPAGVIAIDGLLDSLDPVTLDEAMKRLRQRTLAGAVVMMTSVRPDVIAQMDYVVALRDGEAVFAGTLESLLRHSGCQEIEVQTHRQAAVRALVEPFEVTIEETAGGLVLRTQRGQELAALLLTQGYGDVKFVVLRRPNVDEALRQVI